MSRENTNTFTEFIETHQCIRDHKIHSQLQLDLIEHLWQLQREGSHPFFPLQNLILELHTGLLLLFFC